MGSPTSEARTRLARRLPGAAAPALFGVAAATFALTNAHVFGGASPAARSNPHHTVARVALHRPVAPTARVRSVTRPATRSATRSVSRQKSARLASYTVKSGDTLSVIAKRLYQDPDFWPVLYWANHSRIQYANEIEAGQVLSVPVKPAKIPGAPAALASAPAPSPAPTSAPAPAYAAQAAPAYTAPVQNTNVSTAGDGSFQSCVIARESGGNSQVMNSSGHYGLYQFSASTWAAYGGNPADFGNASVAEQNQVFNTAIAAGGASNWSAYDGC